MAPKRLWTMGVLLSIDQLAHVVFSPILFYRRASEDETISSRLGRVKLLPARTKCIELGHGEPSPCQPCVIGYARISWKYPLARVIDVGLELIDPGHSISAIEHDVDDR